MLSVILNFPKFFEAKSSLSSNGTEVFNIYDEQLYVSFVTLETTSLRSNTLYLHVYSYIRYQVTGLASPTDVRPFYGRFYLNAFFNQWEKFISGWWCWALFLWSQSPHLMSSSTMHSSSPLIFTWMIQGTKTSLWRIGIFRSKSFIIYFKLITRYWTFYKAR